MTIRERKKLLFDPLDDFAILNKCKKCGAITRNPKHHANYHALYDNIRPYKEVNRK